MWLIELNPCPNDDAPNLVNESIFNNPPVYDEQPSALTEVFSSTPLAFDNLHPEERDNDAASSILSPPRVAAMWAAFPPNPIPLSLLPAC